MFLNGVEIFLRDCAIECEFTARNIMIADPVWTLFRGFHNIWSGLSRRPDDKRVKKEWKATELEMSSMLSQCC